MRPQLEKKSDDAAILLRERALARRFCMNVGKTSRGRYSRLKRRPREMLPAHQSSEPSPGSHRLDDIGARAEHIAARGVVAAGRAAKTRNSQ